MVERILNPYFKLLAQAGEEVSSTYEGRHVNIVEGILLHRDNDPEALGIDLVKKGDPVACMNCVGVALATAKSEDDIIPIDTEGIWRLEVVVTGGFFFGGVWVGQPLFIDIDGLITDDWIWAIDFFGYAMEIHILEDVDPETVVMAVKVHFAWPPPWWFGM